MTCYACNRFQLKQIDKELSHFCQSCGMPLDRKEIHGSEKDGSVSDKYCSYCYQQGAFISPDMTLSEMEDLVRTKLQEMKMPDPFIGQAVSALSGLDRWKGKAAQTV